jgi:23S rRNA pseudouridine1911/1915/1917 synthase
MQKIFQFETGPADTKQRLDDFLFSKITIVSRIYTARRIREGFCLVNGETAPGGYKLQAGDKIQITLEISPDTEMKAEKMPLEILYEDEEIIVLNKPVGLLVHPSRYVRSGTLLNGLLYHLTADCEPRIGGFSGVIATKITAEEQRSTNKRQKSVIRIGLPHRLDRETSGLMVVTKTERALSILSTHFERKLVEKTYLALVEGIPTEDAGEIKAPVGRIDFAVPRWQVSEVGRPAETHFKVLKKFADSALLELKPITGRTNQLRVHCAHLGHPIFGDTTRGGREFARLCLHARKLDFFHPNGGWLQFAEDADFFSETI